MKCVAVLLALAAFVVVVNAEPGEHRFTGNYVTHVHRVTYKVEGHGGNGGHGSGDGGKGGDSGKGGKGKCSKQGITGALHGLNKGVQNAGNGIGNALGAGKKHPGILGKIAGGAQTAVGNLAGGVTQLGSDFFCGFNRVFNKFGSEAGKGHLLNGVLQAGNTFVTGAGSFFGNAGTNALRTITSGVSDAVNGRRGKDKSGIVNDNSSHGKKGKKGLLGGLGR